MPVSITQQIEELEVINHRLDTAHRLLTNRHGEVVSFLACLPFPAWIKDLQSRMIYINPTYERLYGVTVEIYNTKLDAEMWPNADASIVEEYVAHDKEAIESGKHQSVTEYYVDPEGVKHPVKVVKWPLFVNGGIVAVDGIAITEI